MQGIRAMQRAGSGDQKDPLARLLATSCFQFGHVGTFAALFRQMLQQYRTDASVSKVAALAPRLTAALPAARRAGSEGIFELLELPGESGKARSRDLLTNGSYNYVYRADVAGDAVVIKHAYVSEDDYRVYLMENVLHAVLGAHEVSRPFVPPLRSVFRLATGAVYPKHRLGACVFDPGHGDVGEFLESKRFTSDAQLVALLVQVAIMLQRLQGALHFQHRDLKVDNLLLTVDGPDWIEVLGGPDAWRCPTEGLGCLLIDFGMARLELGGEYVGCDCVAATTPEYNPFADLQNLCLTLDEDYREELTDQAPRFAAWLRRECAPLRAALLRRCPRYPEIDAEEQNVQLTQLTASARLPSFRPARLLHSLRQEFRRVY
jgi:hypothetical protein